MLSWKKILDWMIRHTKKILFSSSSSFKKKQIQNKQQNEGEEEGEEEEEEQEQVVVVDNDVPLPSTYICNLCKVPGHWRHNCVLYPTTLKLKKLKLKLKKIKKIHKVHPTTLRNKKEKLKLKKYTKFIQQQNCPCDLHSETTKTAANIIAGKNKHKHIGPCDYCHGKKF